MEELQNRRFNEQISKILQNHSTKLKITKGIVINAKINTTDKLMNEQLNGLMYLKLSWGFEEIEIARSGAGIVIKYMDGSLKNLH